MGAPDVVTGSMYTLYRIFCATPWEMEIERDRFHHLVGNFNEAAAMAKGVLFVPVTLVNVRDKRPLQYAVDQNIRDSAYYLLLISGDWGPVERNFRNDYALASQCAADIALPMQELAVLAKSQPFMAPAAEDLPKPSATFSTLEEFDACVNQLLSNYLESLAPKVAAAR